MRRHDQRSTRACTAADLERPGAGAERRVSEVPHRHSEPQQSDRRHYAYVEIRLRVALRIHEFDGRGEDDLLRDRLAESSPKLAHYPVIFSVGGNGPYRARCLYLFDTKAVIACGKGRKRERNPSETTLSRLAPPRHRARSQGPPGSTTWRTRRRPRRQTRRPCPARGRPRRRNVARM